MMTFRCIFGHDWSGPDWHLHPDGSYSWYRRCKRCSKKKTIDNLGRPPSHYVNGREEYYPELVTAIQKAAGVGTNEMTRWLAVRRLIWWARREKENQCPSCGKQKQHYCGMSACIDVCPDCARFNRWRLT